MAVRKVILNEREQQALAWLLSVTENGRSLHARPTYAVSLAQIRKRLCRDAAAHLLRKMPKEAGNAERVQPRAGDAR